MWPVDVPGPDHQFLAQDWSPITDTVECAAMAERWVQRRSAPWSVAWHALETFDYDLNGEFGPWAPPPPFSGHPHWRDLPILPVAWSQTEVLGYIEHCREQARSTFADMTDERAARALPMAHRYGGQSHAAILVGIVGHTTEHAAQIRQFITVPGASVVS